MSESNDQFRRDILDLLHKYLNDNSSSRGVDRAIIQATLQVPTVQMDQNMSFLEEKDLVSLFRLSGSQWTFAKLTADGIDVVENKERYADKFSFTQAATQIQGDIIGKAIQTEQAQVSFAQQVSDAFNQAFKQIETAALSRREKGKIEKQLNELEQELQKTQKADLRTIQKLWVRLMRTANLLCPTVAPVVLEGIKKTLDLS